MKKSPISRIRPILLALLILGMPARSESDVPLNSWKVSDLCQLAGRKISIIGELDLDEHPKLEDGLIWNSKKRKPPKRSRASRNYERYVNRQQSFSIRLCGFSHLDNHPEWREQYIAANKFNDQLVRVSGTVQVNFLGHTGLTDCSVSPVPVEPDPPRTEPDTLRPRKLKYPVIISD